MIVVDTSVWIDNLRDRDNSQTRGLRTMHSVGDIVVGDLVMLEVLQGARDDRHAARIEQHLRRYRVEPMLDADLAVDAARHYRHLRGLGVTIRKTADLVIATFCLARGYRLLHRDRDFGPFVAHLGLEIADPATL